jgi:hypothetical protein
MPMWHHIEEYLAKDANCTCKQRPHQDPTPAILYLTCHRLTDIRKAAADQGRLTNCCISEGPHAPQGQQQWNAYW